MRELQLRPLWFEPVVNHLDRPGFTVAMVPNEEICLPDRLPRRSNRPLGGTMLWGHGGISSVGPPLHRHEILSLVQE